LGLIRYAYIIESSLGYNLYYIEYWQNWITSIHVGII
jgi:hypothetical protein